MRNLIDDTGAHIGKRRRRWIPLSAVASVLLLVMVGFFVGHSSEEMPLIVRGTGLSASPSEYSVLNAAPTELSWSDDAPSAPYTVEMFDGDGNRLWRVTDIPGSPIPVSDESQRAIERTGAYFWVITASDGTHHGPFWFRVESP